MRRQGPSYDEIVHKCLRVQPPLGGGKSPTSRCPEAVDWNMMCVLQGVRTLVPEEGVAYIECARTPAIPHYKEFNVHKDGALLVTLALSALNDLNDYGVNACPLLF